MWKEIKNTRYEICDLTADVRNKITGRILRQFDNGKGDEYLKQNPKIDVWNMVYSLEK